MLLIGDLHFENIVKSVENAFLLLTRNFIPERYMKALEDDFSTEKLNNEVIESITECVENGGLYYNPCGPMIVSEFSIEDIGRNIEHVLKDKLSERMVDHMDKNYVIFKEE